jgi:hypothetical protein
MAHDYEQEKKYEQTARHDYELEKKYEQTACETRLRTGEGTRTLTREEDAPLRLRIDETDDNYRAPITVLGCPEVIYQTYYYPTDN